jgi:hypothetical protein
MPIAIEPSKKRGSNTAMNFAQGSDPIQISRAKAWQDSWPYILGCGVGLAYECFGSHLPFSPNLKDVFSAIISVAGLAAAFFLTSASILVSLKDSWFKQRAKEAGTYNALIGYMLTAMGWSLVLAVCTAGALLFDVKWNLPWYRHALAAWILIAVTTLGLAVRVLKLFSLLMKYIAEE